MSSFTLPVTIGVKLLTPNAAFLDQMWLAGISLFVILAGISLARPEEPAGEKGPEGQASKGESAGGHPPPLKERDLLFDFLCVGVVVATVGLVVFFW